jgi:outer membrane protein assembly factor BamA
MVRTPGRVGLRYVLDGVEVRGNTTTLSRVVLRYVPFHAGDTIDVDDSELELTRFRLLGTGFFRDVQLSLRKGSKRGNAILVVSVVERNTIILNDVWLGLATDANSSGKIVPLTAYGGFDAAETNLAGTGITLSRRASSVSGRGSPTRSSSAANGPSRRRSSTTTRKTTSATPTSSSTLDPAQSPRTMPSSPTSASGA